ncbi:MAG: hypothetical protein ACJAYG_001046 [Oceanicoccus sp.]|jgi:hypothetical protein
MESPFNNSALKLTTIKALWLNPGNKRFWFLLALLLYTLLGFFAAPVLIKNTILSITEQDLGRSAAIKKVEFNPYQLSLSIQGLQLQDTDDTPLLAFDEFFVNFQLSSIVRRAWTFREIRLTNPYLFFERFDTDDTRLSRLMAAMATEQVSKEASEKPTTDPEPPEDVGLPRLLIEVLLLEAGRIDVMDHVPAQPLATKLGPIDISVQMLNTLPNKSGHQSVNIQLTETASLHWGGSLNLAPLESEGELQLKNLQLSPASHYLSSVLSLEAIKATLSTDFNYSASLKDNGEMSIEINQLKLQLSDLKLKGLTPSTEFLSITAISLDGGEIKYPQQSAQFSNLTIDQPRLNVWLDEQAKLSLQQLSPASASDEGPTNTDSEEKPWAVGIDTIAIKQGQFQFVDNSIIPSAVIPIKDFNLQLLQAKNQDNAQIPIVLSANIAEQGQLNLRGDISVLPSPTLEIKAEITQLPLTISQPYVQQTLRALIKDGFLAGTFAINLSKDGALTVEGATQIQNLQINNDVSNQPLLSWKNLDIDQFKLDLQNNNVHFSRFLFEQPFADVAVYKDQTTNLSALLITDTKSSATTVEKTAEPMAVTIGGILLENGSMNFSDFSLPLPFTTYITDLKGSVSTIATDSSEAADIRIEGQVDEFGLARIDGNINVMDPIQNTDITINFRNLAMTNFSPYSAQFAGRKIASGKLELNLEYLISAGQLKGKNSVILSDLTLGEDVESPDATSLPLDLALGLLKDPEGNIDIKLPVEGNVDDPEFKIGGVIWNAFSSLISDIVSAPFRMLGNLLGISAEELGQIEFLAGRADLTPPEREKIAQLQQAILQRPELVIEISGASASALDKPALQYQQLKTAILLQMDKDSLPNSGDKRDVMLDSEIRSQLENLFEQRFPDISLKALRKQYTVPPVDNPTAKAEFDDLAYAIDLRDQLLAQEIVTKQDLLALAELRANTVKEAFISHEQLESTRVVVIKSTETDQVEGEWITLNLSVGTK